VKMDEEAKEWIIERVEGKARRALEIIAALEAEE
jgi:DNA polymerase III delta prime subunit